jgi:hypothetical protein
MLTPPPRSSRRTPRRRNIFRERDVRRAIRAARLEGVEQIQINSDSGTITLLLGEPPKGDGAIEPTPLEQWRAKRSGQG